jgi:hypothetical protein
MNGELTKMASLEPNEQSKRGTWASQAQTRSRSIEIAQQGSRYPVKRHLILSILELEKYLELEMGLRWAL